MAYIDISGQRFGRLVALKKGDGRRTSGGAHKTTWVCRCDCGAVCEVDGQKLRKGHTTSCGCLKHENKGSSFEDLTGKKFGRLTVVGFLPQEERSSPTYCWRCVCDCGKEVFGNAAKMKSGVQVSCGCYRNEMIGNLNKKYEYSNKRLYGVYKSMLSRCYDENHREYHNYGGRGIKVCDEWLGEFGYDAFAKVAYAKGYDANAEFHECTLERIDVNGDYEPNNICWITNQQQQENRRDVKLLEYNGEWHPLKTWARILGQNYNSMLWYCQKKGMSIEEYMNR